MSTESFIERQGKIARIEALREKKRRLLAKRPTYTPNEGQLPIHQSKKLERWVFSANGTGKTTALAQEVQWAAYGYNPILKVHTKAPCKIVVVLDKSDKIGEVFMPEYRKWFDLPDDWCKKKGKPHVAEITFPNGSSLSFYSAESDPMTFEGFMADYAFIDEPLPKPLVTAIRRSLRIKKSPSKLLFFGTAVSQAWLRTEIYEPWSKDILPHVECFRVGVEVNKANLAEGYIERFSSGLSDAEKEVRLKGGWFDSDSLALAHLWNRRVHILKDERFEYNPEWPCVIAIDPHPAKPHTALMLTCTKSNSLIAIKELRLRSNASTFAAALFEWKEGYNVIDIVCDSSGNTPGTSFEGMHGFIEGLQAEGVRVRPTDFKEKNHEDLLSRLQQVLTIPEDEDQFEQTLPRLRVLASLHSLISDIENATWQKNRVTGETIMKIETSIKDHLSCLGYALATGLFFDKATRPRATYKKDLAERVTGPPAARTERREQLIAHRRGRLVSRRLLRRKDNNSL